MLSNALSQDRGLCHTTVDALRASLRRWFGVEFSMLDIGAAEYLYQGSLVLGGDPTIRAAVCRELISRGKPAFVAEEEPIVLLALPIPGGADSQLAALAPFVVQQVDPTVIARAAKRLAYDSQSTSEWAQQQTVWNAERLIAVAELAVTCWNNQTQLQIVQGENDALSGHLLATYEEISLLYRLTQNLKLSGSNDNLGRIALNWLSDAIPAEGFALAMSPTLEGAKDSAANLSTPVFLQYGRCSIDAAGFSNLLEKLNLNEQPRPVVINSARRHDLPGIMHKVRQVVIVPMVEGERLFGWLAAFNHTGEGEFGSTEANLLSSVAAILGIHAGNVELYRQQGEFMAGVVRALTSAIDAKDPYTCGHSDRVARVAVRLARELGCSLHDLETIYLSGLLHDIGKIGIDDQVLRKPGKLTEAEYEHIKLHAEIGYRILKDIKQLDQVLPVVRHHHEAWNGNGYPFGLSGDEIPYFARIVAVADAFDAMSSDRPYRKGIPDDQLDAILREGAGTQWDATVVETFFSIREEIRKIMQLKPAKTIKVVHDVVVPSVANLPCQIAPVDSPSGTYSLGSNGPTRE